MKDQMDNIELEVLRQAWWEDLNTSWLSVLNIISDFYKLGVEKSIELKLNSDRELWYCLQTAWDNSPDESWVKDLPGWETFVTLCVEGWVLFEPNEEISDGV